MPQEPMIELQQEQSRNSSGLMELGLNRAKVLTLPQLWQVTLTCCQGVSFISPPFCFADARPDAGEPSMQVDEEHPAPQPPARWRPAVRACRGARACLRSSADHCTASSSEERRVGKECV